MSCNTLRQVPFWLFSKAFILSGRKIFFWMNGCLSGIWQRLTQISCKCEITSWRSVICYLQIWRCPHLCSLINICPGRGKVYCYFVDFHHNVFYPFYVLTCKRKCASVRLFRWISVALVWLFRASAPLKTTWGGCCLPYHSFVNLLPNSFGPTTPNPPGFFTLQPFWCYHTVFLAVPCSFLKLKPISSSHPCFFSDSDLFS